VKNIFVVLVICAFILTRQPSNRWNDQQLPRARVKEQL